MRLNVIARKTHKWFGLLIGLQVVIWSLSGLYMTVVHIDTIHGDHLTRQALPKTVAAAELMNPVEVAAANEAHGFRLAWVRDRPAYVLEGATGEMVVDARKGRPVEPLTEAEIRSIAGSAYTGKDSIASAALITEIPGEIRGRKPPLWRVEFDHWNKPTFYISPSTGELIARRHELWRIFDFVWMLHIMDYETRDNVNNLVLRSFTWGAVLMASSGIWLLTYSFHRKKKKKQAARA